MPQTSASFLISFFYKLYPYFWAPRDDDEDRIGWEATICSKFIVVKDTWTALKKENDLGELVSARVVVPHYGRAYPIYSRLENHILQDTRG